MSYCFKIMEIYKGVHLDINTDKNSFDVLISTDRLLELCQTRLFIIMKNNVE